MISPEALPYVALLVGALATYVSRFLGVLLAGRLQVESPLFEWLSCVTYALLAALIARMIIFPSGPLAEAPLFDRLAAATLALASFYLTRRNLLLGVAAGFATLVLVTWVRVSGSGLLAAFQL